MKSDWFVSPASLSRARTEQLLSIEQLVKKSGISLRSIQAYERREQRVRLDTLQCLATALAVEVKDIAAIRTMNGKGATAKNGTRSPPAPAPPSTLPPRTQLETLVDLERAANIHASPLDTPRGPAETLTAKRLQDVFTAYALHDGALFCLTGKVDGMRGLPPTEATLLGSRGGVAARFHIVKEVVPGQLIGVTVHTARKDDTAKLQKKYGAEVTLFVRVVVVPAEPRDDGPGFSSFITRITAKRPWTFVVEEIVETKAPAAAKSTLDRPASTRKRATRA
jgi:transcriptional regulator with XRE-family HTH domain